MPETKNGHPEAMRITKWTFQLLLRDAREASLLTQSEWQLGWLLSSFMDRNGYCYPSIPTLVAKMGNKVSNSQNTRCAKALRRLEDAGFIATVIGGGRHKSNAFYATATRAMVAACGMQTPEEWPEQLALLFCV